MHCPRVPRVVGGHLSADISAIVVQLDAVIFQYICFVPA